MHSPFILWIKFLHVQMICITDLYYCVNAYIVIFLYFYMFVTCSTSCCLVTASGIHGMYVHMFLPAKTTYLGVVWTTPCLYCLYDRRASSFWSPCLRTGLFCDLYHSFGFTLQLMYCLLHAILCSTQRARLKYPT
jgi:hypothetical protein